MLESLRIITIVIVNLSFESNIIVGTYEIERSRACREESRVSGFSLYDAKLACTATAWCEMFYQKDDGFYFCSYGAGTYYDPYATLYRKPSKRNPNFCFSLLIIIGFELIETLLF